MTDIPDRLIHDLPNFAKTISLKEEEFQRPLLVERELIPETVEKRSGIDSVKRGLRLLNTNLLRLNPGWLVV
jgi:hypothetical protein